MLLMVLLVAIFLRVYQLDAESLWLDEAISVCHAADDSLIQVLNGSCYDEHNPPLYFLLLHYWIQLFGDSEVSVRLPLVLFGVFSVAMLYKLGAMLFNK